MGGFKNYIEKKIMKEDNSLDEEIILVQDAGGKVH